MMSDDPFSGLRELLRDLRSSHLHGSDEAPAVLPARGVDASPRTGEWLGSYQLLELLGQGGMGVVYRASDAARNRTVALKTLLRIDARALQRFKQEFRSLADLAHPNLVTLYELLGDGDRWWFTMQLVEGVILDRYLSDLRGLDAPAYWQRFRDVFRQLAAGVLALHDGNKLHRDIKPSNVLVTPTGAVVLVDFGLAAEMDRTGLYESISHHMAGTIAYMSPEQARGRGVTAASDWYSVGVVLYEALTGQLPFTGTASDVIDAKFTAAAPPLDAVAAGVPEDLARLAVDLLQPDPHARPDGRQVLERFAVAPERAPRAHRSYDIPFVGRERELGALRHAFRESRSGRPVIVFVSGSSGAGKTALLQTFLGEAAADPRVLVLAGRCYEQESMPFKALDNLIDRLTDHLLQLRPIEVQALLPRDVRTLARVFPVLRQVKEIGAAPVAGAEAIDPVELRRRAGAALRELLARLGDRRRLVLAVDDLQWGDADSASLLMDILSTVDAPTFLGIGCYRAEDAQTSPFFEQLRRMRATSAAYVQREIEVGPLDAGEARQLAMKLLGGIPDDALTQGIVRESAGQPFLVYELVEYVRALIEGADIGQQVALTDVLWQRIERLPEESRRLLEVVAIAGRPIAPADACAAAGLHADARALLPTLRSARLIRGIRNAAGNAVETYHDRVRQCVAEHLTHESAQQYHRRLARVLTDAGAADPQALAFHFDRGGEPDRASAYYLRAATDAAHALAFDQAAGLYQRALELHDWPVDERCRLRTALGDALANAGRGPRAAAQYLLAAGEADADTSIELQRRAALQLLTSGHVDEGLARLGPVLKSVGTRLADTPFRALVSLLARRAQVRARGLAFVRREASTIPPPELRAIDIGWSVVIGLSMIDPIRAADFQTRSLLLALRVGEPTRVARALAVEAGHLASSGSPVRALPVLAQAERLASTLDSAYVDGIVKMARSTVHYFSQQWPESLRYARDAEAVFRQRCTGATWETATSSAFTLWSLAKMGDLAELKLLCPPLLKEARERGDRYATTNLSTQIMSLVHLSTDEPAAARADVDSVMRLWSQRGYHVQHHDALHALVPLELYCGTPEAAWERVRKDWTAFRWSLLSHIQDVRIEMLQMRAYTALAVAARRTDRRALLQSALADARRLRRERLAWPVAIAEYVEGTAAATDGDDETAARRLTSALTGFDAIEARLLAAATRTRLAALIGGTEGQHVQGAADAWFKAQGVRQPLRLAAAFAPGFPALEPEACSPAGAIP